MRIILKKYFLLVSLFSIAVTNISWTHYKLFTPTFLHKGSVLKAANPAMELYSLMNLNQKGLTEEAFLIAMNGFEILRKDGILKNDSILTIADFNQSSSNKRLYVLDIKNVKILFNTYVAHGKNSGREWAQSFSNKMESEKSSLGFYLTENIYNGSNGYSLKLAGLEKNINDNALTRGIVVHGASYVNSNYANSPGAIGRSHGCPAVPRELNRPIITAIKNGSCFFIYNKLYHPSQTFSAG